MKSLVLASSLLICITATSQVTLIKTDFAGANETFHVHVAASLSADIETTGPNSIWDFSELSTNGTEEENTYAISSGGMVMSFQFGPTVSEKYRATYFQPFNGLPLEQLNMIPNLMPISIESVNQVVKVADDKITYVGYSLKVQGNLVGFRSDTIEVAYQLPLEYEDVYESTGHTVMSFVPFYDGKIIQHRKRRSEVDGFGELITPYGVYENVVRIKHKVNEKDSIRLVLQVGSINIDQWLPPVNRTIHHYEWWDNNRGRPILRIETEGAFGNEVPTRITFINEELQSNNLTENTLQAMVYPNPTSDYIRVELEEPISEIKIYDALGKLVFQKDVDSYEAQIDVSSYTSGVYYVHSITKSGRNVTPVMVN